MSISTDIESLRTAAAQGVVLHPDDPRYAALKRLIDDWERKTKALEEIAGHSWAIGKPKWDAFFIDTAREALDVK